jgi:hypothetical protein
VSRAFSSGLRLAALAAFVAVVAVVAAACGRSNLDLDVSPLTEGGLNDVTEDGNGDVNTPDVPTCNASTCPKGCCSAAAQCLVGAAADACGTGGEACQNCTAEGYEFCYETTQACGNAVNNCGPGNCKGCCVGGVCLAGSDPTECGIGGAACTNCQAEGEACNGGQCVTPTPCGPSNCSGCCEGNVCQPGNASNACGTAGNACTNCAVAGDNCQNAQCVAQAQCNAQNCGFGCCEGNVCVTGSSNTACGFGGQSCQDCQAFGDVCQGQVCQGQTQCNAQTCGFGCCQGNFCVTGSLDTECGFGGQSCQDCQAFGETCQGQVCQGGGTCNAQTCPNGCCLGGACIPGTLDNACGFGGQACQNCQTFGDVCQGQICVSSAGCNASNCFGCCEGNVCVPGTASNACGFGGEQCTNCQGFGDICEGQQCQSACNGGNCQGCCDANQMCQPGFLNNQCGGFGAPCADCTALNPPSTCNDSVNPPQCASQQMVCPSPYPGCGAPPEGVAAPMTACTSSDLQNAAAACAGGAATTACQNFFNFLFSQAPACGQCLSSFDYDFVAQQGVFDCVAPFVPAACNQTDACDYDCATQSCGSCPDQTSYDTCLSSVGTGQCSNYQQSANACLMNAYANGGSFCNPSGYANFGAWLQGVGAYYCDMGPVPDGGVLDGGFGGD